MTYITERNDRGDFIDKRRILDLGLCPFCYGNVDIVFWSKNCDLHFLCDVEKGEDCGLYCTTEKRFLIHLNKRDRRIIKNIILRWKRIKRLPDDMIDKRMENTL